MFPLGAVAVILSLGALFLPSAVGLAAPTAKPSNTAEPTISGQAEQGRTLSASRGSWTGTGSISYAYRWVRCGPDGGRPDASNCGSIPGATRSRYELVGADLGYRLRVRVTASNSEGSETVASNPTATVVGPPVNASLPLVSGTALVGSLITVHPGSWTGRQPIGFSYAWLRCNSAGGECLGIGGATGRSYRLTRRRQHKMRVNVTARNAITSVTVLSSESAVVSVPLPAGAIRLPTGEISIPASSVPSDQRLIVSRVAFSPNPVTSSSRPLDRARSRLRLEELRRSGRRRVRPLDAAGHGRRAAPDGDRRVADVPAAAARGRSRSRSRETSSSSSRRTARATRRSAVLPGIASCRCERQGSS